MAGFLKWVLIIVLALTAIFSGLAFWGSADSRLDMTFAHIPPASGTAPDTPSSPPFARHLASPYLKYRTMDGTRAGYAMAAAKSGTLSYALRYGVADMETGAPIEVNTRFRIASMTKPITATAAMILIERGAIALSDPVSKYIPAFTDIQVWDHAVGEPVPTDHPVTLHHLLTFTAGIGSNNRNDDTPLGKLWADALQPLGSITPLSTRAQAIASLPLYNQPGETWHYGNSLTVMARVIEVASGQPFEDFLDTEIFTPLGMTDTSFMPPPGARQNIAALYTHDEHGNPAPLADPPFDAEGRINGDGRLISTLPDYMRFALMLWNKGSYQETRILSEASVEAMTTPHVKGGVLSAFDIEGLGWGYGLAVVMDADATPMPDKPGDFFWSGVNGTHFWISPADGTVFVYMTQYRAPSHDTGRPRGAEIPFVVQAVVNPTLR